MNIMRRKKILQKDLSIRIIRKYFFSLFLIVFVISGKGQNMNSQADSLSKYSYTIFGIDWKSSVLDAGTCSFYERNGSLFLITAKHILYRCDSLTMKQRPKFEFATIFLSTNSKFLQFKIPSLNDSCIIDYKDPDLFIIKVDYKWLSKVNTIGQFIMPPLKVYGELQILDRDLKVVLYIQLLTNSTKLN